MTGLPSLRMLPVHAWPEIDRQLWKAAKDDTYVATLNPAALSAIAQGYGRWLAVLCAATIRMVFSGDQDGDYRG